MTTRLDADRRDELSDRIARGLVAASTLLLLETHQHLGVPPMDCLIAAVAEDHGAAMLHYDADFERLAAHTDLAIALEPLAPLGSLP